MSKVRRRKSKPSRQRVCVITGGSSGIGYETAFRFAQERFHIAICGRNAERLASVAEDLESNYSAKVHHCVTDLSTTGAAASFVEEAARALGGVDVLVNNAGLAPNFPVEKFSAENLAEVLAVNITAVVEATTAAWKIMKHAGHGAVVNVSSLAAIDPFPGFSVYGGTKAFVETFTQAIANEGKDDGISAFCIRPGAVDTPLLRSLFPEFPPEERLHPTYVADLIWNLCTEMHYSSGETITIKK